MIFEAVIILHLAAAALLSLGMVRGVVKAPPVMIPMLILMPLVGELVVLSLHFHTLLGKDGKDFQDLNEGSRINTSVDSEFFRRDTRDTSIPVEDALILHKGRQRQTILRNAIMHDTIGNQIMLLDASRNPDPEIVHFATTALAQLMTRNEKKFSELDKNLADAKKTGGDHALLEAYDAYIDALNSYLKNSAKDAQWLVRQKQMTRLLKARCALRFAPESLLLLAEASLDQGDFKTADAALDEMDRSWPNDPETWILRFRSYYLRRDRAAMDVMIGKYQTEDVLHSQKIDEMIKPWIREGEG
ncbi:MAG: hypothetical protein U0L49_03695 [Eubacterium sp.]|nr:hypothetical protein [Eubacterium sp.]